MEFNNKKLERTSKFIHYTISIVLCLFLIALFGKIISDIGRWKEQPKIDEFFNSELINSNKLKIKKLDTKIKTEEGKRKNINNNLRIVNSDYSNAKKSFDNWLETRKATGSSKEDKAVLLKTKQLDEYYKKQQKWESELSKISIRIENLEDSVSQINTIIDKERDRAHKAREKEIRKYELKVFLIRLLVILPILILAIFFILKFRRHKYWSLFLGFVLFAFYAFFVGLVPYLPSYGGYVRYSVGIILSVALGIYSINKIKAFIEQKKKELQTSGAERAKKVQTETAEKALDNHICPSCGKDFIITDLNNSANKKDKTAIYGSASNFCRFCGLELFKKCDECGTVNFVHLPFCSNCGKKNNND